MIAEKPNSCILSFDTTGAMCSLALTYDGAIFEDSFSSKLSSDYAAFLVPRLNALLQKAGKSYRDLDALCVIRGPGSFTGIRIGLSVATGYKIALSIPIFAPTLLEVWAYAASPAKPTFVAMDTHKDSAFCQMFSVDLMPLSDAEILGWETVHEQAGSNFLVSDAPVENIAAASLKYYNFIAQAGRLGDYQSLEPFYVIEPEFKRKDAVLKS